MQTVLPLVLGATLLMGAREWVGTLRRSPLAVMIAAFAAFTLSVAAFDFGPQFYLLAVAATALAVGLVLRALLLRTDPGSLKLDASAPVVVLAGCCTWLAVRELFADGLTNDLFALLLSMSVLIAVALLQQNGAALSREDFFALLSFVCTFVLLIALLRFDTDWRPCRGGKCSVFGGLYRGPFENENAVGQLGAWLTLAALAARSSGQRVPALCVGGVLVLASGSRTALFALCGALAAGWVIGAASKQRGVLHRARRPLALLAVAAPAVASLYLVARAGTDDFSFRGRRWAALRDELGGVLSWSGAGTGTWNRIESTFDQQTSAHSTYGLLLAYGGLIAVALFVIALYRLVLSRTARSRRQLAFDAMPVVLLALIAITEVIWNPTTLNNRSWVVLAVFAVGAGGSIRTADPKRGDLRRSHA